MMGGSKEKQARRSKQASEQASCRIWLMILLAAELQTTSLLCGDLEFLEI
jgi:hypothetical protein